MYLPTMHRLAAFAPICLAMACAAPRPTLASEPVVEVRPAPSAESSADGAVNLRRARALDGVYRWPHEVTYVCDEPDWCTEDVTDTLTIRQHSDGLQIKIELVQTNYHVCNWEGVLRAVAQDTWGSETKGCSIELKLEPEKIRISSAGCRDYCGARAHLEAEFAR
jgi:hypothetical protein